MTAERPPVPYIAPDDRRYRTAVDAIRRDLAAGTIGELAINRLRSRYRLSEADARRARAAMLRAGLVRQRGRRMVAA